MIGALTLIGFVCCAAGVSDQPSPFLPGGKMDKMVTHAISQGPPPYLKFVSAQDNPKNETRKTANSQGAIIKNPQQEIPAQQNTSEELSYLRSKVDLLEQSNQKKEELIESHVRTVAKLRKAVDMSMQIEKNLHEAQSDERELSQLIVEREHRRGMYKSYAVYSALAISIAWILVSFVLRKMKVLSTRIKSASRETFSECDTYPIYNEYANNEYAKQPAKSKGWVKL